MAILGLLASTALVPPLTNSPFQLNQNDNWMWSGVEVVSVDSTSVSDNVKIAVDSQDNLHVVWQDPTNYQGVGIDADVFYMKYTASSLSWSSIEVLSKESVGNSQAPNIAIDFEDNVHVVWQDQSNFNSSFICLLIDPLTYIQFYFKINFILV